MNLRLGETALDLLAWDRYRTVEDPDRSDAAEVELLIDRGSACHRRLLAAVHGAREDGCLAESGEWLSDSKVAWIRRPAMTEKGSFLGGTKLNVTDEDIARLDRLHPELTFSARASAANDANEGDLAGALERLGGLRREGLLSEDEFRAAKAKLLR